MGVLLQGFFKLAPNRAVPSPADGDKTIPWWWDHLAAQANAFRQAGFTAVWLPPVLKTSAGVTKAADGYEPFDDYDIGSKKQMGSVPTRFGSREQLQRCVATFRANGVDVYLDMVEHHRGGDPGNRPFVFRYQGAGGEQDIGRFSKSPLNFVPNVPRDPNLGGPPRDDFPFGRELAPINAKPKNYVFNGLVDAADWLTRALDVQGYRLDDVKGLSTDFLFPFLNSKSLQGKFAFGEFFDGNTTLVNGWVFNPHGMRGRASAFDFPLRFILQAMCNNAGRFNMADLDHAAVDQFLGLKANEDTYSGGALPSPSTITVAVMNGSGTSNQASDTAAGLKALGFNIGTVGDATPVGREAETVVYYSSKSHANLAAAQAVANSMSGSVIMAMDPTQVQPGSQVTVVTGTQFSVNPPPATVTPTSAAGNTGAATTTPTTSSTTTTTSGAFQPPTTTVEPLAAWDPRSCTASGGEGP